MVAIHESSEGSEISQGANIARSLTWRYAIALALVASLSTAAWLSLDLVISAQKSTAAIVNVSGRQRMLSQRTALFAGMLASSPVSERPAIRIKLKDAIELMSASHRGLIHGDKEMGLPDTMSASVRAMYFEGPNPLDTQVTTYVKAVLELLRKRNEAIRQDDPLLQYISRTAPTTLVASLDKMVGQYQLEGENSIRALQRAESFFWLLTLFLLTLEAALIFHPFVKHIKHVLGQLKFATEELKVHQERLEELVMQRTRELERKNNDLAESEEKFRLMSNSAKDAIAIISEDELVTYWNPAAESMFGYSQDEIIGENLHELLAPSGMRKDAHGGFGSFRHSGMGKLIGKTIEIKALRKDGTEFDIELSISSLKLRNKWNALGIIRDISERKIHEVELKRQAFIDYLTGVNNRGHFMELAELELNRTVRYANPLSILMMDIDFFKKVNDTYGHKIGDMVLKRLAEVCVAALREVDIIGRIGGEEFAILLPETDTNEAKEVAERLRDSVEKTRITLEGGGLPLQSTVSIGVASLRSREDNIDVLLNLADGALYTAKANGRNRVCAAHQ